MQRIDTPKKPAGPLDWNPAYIVYQLRLKGLSFRRLARLNGYAQGSATLVNRIAWPKMESLVARAIGVPPQQIWPSRYNPDGTPKRGLHSRKGRTSDGTDSSSARNVHVRRAA
jgi:Ner family transcriptional regulator